MWALPSGRIKRGAVKGRLLVIWWDAIPSSAELIYFVAVAADSSGIRISVSRLPRLTEHRKLSRAPPGSQGQIGTPEALAP